LVERQPVCVANDRTAASDFWACFFFKRLKRMDESAYVVDRLLARFGLPVLVWQLLSRIRRGGRF
jgi:hypothetical protein